MTVKLDHCNRPEPDLLLTTAEYDGDRTWFTPDEVQLVIEVVSPESAHRDRTVKLRRYAEAGIPHYWCIEDEGGTPVVHVYELDEATRVYAPAGIFRDTLKRTGAFRDQPGSRQGRAAAGRLVHECGGPRSPSPALRDAST